MSKRIFVNLSLPKGEVMNQCLVVQDLTSHVRVLTRQQQELGFPPEHGEVFNRKFITKEWQAKGE